MNKIRKFAATALVLALASTVAYAGKNDLTVVTPFGTGPALAFSWGASNTGSVSPGGGGGVGKVNFQDVSITRTPDAQSSKLLESVAKGTFLTSVTISKGTMQLILTNVLITAYATGGADGDKSTESVSMSARKFSYTADGGVPFCFDIATNSAC